MILSKEKDWIKDFSQRLLTQNPSIVFIGIVNENGNLEDYLKSNDFHTSLLSADDWTSLSIQSMLAIRMQSDYDGKLSKIKFSFHQRESCSIYVALINRFAIFIMSKDGFDKKLANELDNIPDWNVGNLITKPI